MTRPEQDDPIVVLPRGSRRQFRLRTLFLAQAVVALLLSYFLAAGWLGVLGMFWGAVAGMLLGSCYEMIRRGSPKEFLPRKWETRGAVLGGVAAMCGGFVHAEAAVVAAMIALLILLLVYVAVSVVVMVVGLAKGLARWLNRARRNRGGSSIAPTSVDSQIRSGMIESNTGGPHAHRKSGRFD